jgi:hypothetical protein
MSNPIPHFELVNGSLGRLSVGDYVQMAQLVPGSPFIPGVVVEMYSSNDGDFLVVRAWDKCDGRRFHFRSETGVNGPGFWQMLLRFTEAWYLYKAS